MKSHLITVLVSFATCLGFQILSSVDAVTASSSNFVRVDELHAKKIVVEDAADAPYRVIIGSFPFRGKGSIVSVEKKDSPSVALMNLDHFGPIICVDRDSFVMGKPLPFASTKEGHDFAISYTDINKLDFRPAFQALDKTGKLKTGILSELVVTN